MGYHNKTVQTEASVKDFLASLGSETLKRQSLQLVALMEVISGNPPKMWGPSIIGFDRYRYRYASGREGVSGVIGFSPRKNYFVVYLADGTAKYETVLKSLGEHMTGKVCLFVKSLSDIDMAVLAALLKASYIYTKSLDGKVVPSRV
jgi:hypothetical protein